MASPMTAAQLLAAFQSPPSSPTHIKSAASQPPHASMSRTTSHNVPALPPADQPRLNHEDSIMVQVGNKQPTTTSATLLATVTDTLSLVTASTSPKVRLHEAPDTESENESVVEIAPPPRPPVELRRSERRTVPRVPIITKKSYGPRTNSKSTLTSTPISTPTSNIAKAATLALSQANLSRFNTFLRGNSHLFLPLLPEKNYVARLQTVEYTKGSHSGNIIDHEVESAAMAPRETISPPIGLSATLKPHQLDGLSFLVWAYKNCVNTILGDEMGLGKTIQTLSFFQWLKEQIAAPVLPHLVVCPLSVMTTWMNEAQRFTPNLKFLRFHGPAKERQAMKEQVRRSLNSFELDCVVATYETVEAEISWFSTIRWHSIVLDEGHKIKNAKTNIAKACQMLRGQSRLILTGTPIQNNLFELWSLLFWLYPTIFTLQSREIFEQAFDLGRGRVNTSLMDQCNELLKVIMLRRLVQGVNLELPPKIEIFLHVPLTLLQRTWYQRLITRLGDQEINNIFSTEDNPLLAETTSTKAVSKGSAWLKLNNLLMQLRMVSIHPYLIKGVQPDPYYLGDHVIHASSKFILLSKLIDDLVLQKRQKVIIFSGFTSVLDCCEDLLHLKGGDGTAFRYCRLDGSSNAGQRSKAKRLFQHPNGNWRVILLSIKAGGLGINLQAASNMIMLDQDFNPQNMLQAQARAHRIGQTLPVTVYNICTTGTVEEQMMTRLQKKLYLSTRVSGIAATNVEEQEEETTLSTSAMKGILFAGTRALTEQVDNPMDMLTWDTTAVIDKCTANSTVDESANATDEQAWLAKLERVKTAMLDGVELERRNKEEEHSIDVNLERSQRRLGKETTVLMDGFAISKNSMGCAQWEAVPTLAGKDPKLAEYKREKKAPVPHEQHCQVCKKKGSLLQCASCPRAYHETCSSVPRRTGFGTQFYCSQHICHDCEKKSGDAGGMLYRCRCCARAYCDDCLDWDSTDSWEDIPEELAAHGFLKNENAFYLRCPACRLENRPVNMNASLATRTTDSTTALRQEIIKHEIVDLTSGCTTPLTPASQLTRTHSQEGTSPESVATPATVPSRGAVTPEQLKRKFADWTFEDDTSGRQKISRLE